MIVTMRWLTAQRRCTAHRYLRFPFNHGDRSSRDPAAIGADLMTAVRRAGAPLRTDHFGVLACGSPRRAPQRTLVAFFIATRRRIASLPIAGASLMMA